MTSVSALPHAAKPALHQIDPVPRVSIHAFCETDEVFALIGAAAADRRMAKAQIKQVMGGGQAAIEAYGNAPTRNVIVLEAPADGRELIDRLDELAHMCDAGTKVVVAGRANDIVLYRQLMARGVSEYLVAPFGAVDFVQGISQLFRAPGAKPLGRLIGFVGAKGGVGASTIAHNLAWSLASITKMATIIADFDLAFGTAALNYNQDPPQGVADAVFDPGRVDSMLVDRVLSKCGDHLSLLAAPAALDRVLDFSETSFDTLLDAMRAAAPWIVLDVPHVWSGWARRALIASDELMVVANPDLANLRNAKNLIDALKAARLHDHPPRLVLNGVGMLKRPEIATAEFAKTVGVEPIAIIPHDAKLFGSAANNGQMLAELEPKGKSAQIFVNLASAIAGRREKGASRKSLFDPFIGKLARKRAEGAARVG
jgi:pilus assembly protein CpaE